MQYIHSQKSWKRLFRQFLFIPFFHNQWLTTRLKQDLVYTIAHAESGHQGEICLVIENCLPVRLAYWQDSRARAFSLFETYQVWDTPENTGVLIYVNVCERTLEIVADCGIDSKLPLGCWHELCQTALQDFQIGQMQSGLFWLIEAVGELLRVHYPTIHTQSTTSNRPVFL